MLEKKDVGYIESAQRLLQQDQRTWSQERLLAVAERAELRNTGWPIGLVIQRPGLSPIPTPDGIEARFGRTFLTGEEGGQDYWSFRRDGSYYVVRVFEEEFEKVSFTSSRPIPERAIWFDIRIWRIAEMILHSASIYRELGVPADEPYALQVNHGGLMDREFFVSTARRWVEEGNFCRTPEVRWSRIVTQDYIVSNTKPLVREICQGFFVLFNFKQVQDNIIDEIVEQFLNSRV